MVGAGHLRVLNVPREPYHLLIKYFNTKTVHISKEDFPYTLS